MTDGELVRLVLAGQTQRYEELVRRWARRIAALCHAHVGNAGPVADLTQETLLRGFRNLRALTETEKFGPWLCGIALRASLNWLRQHKRSATPFSDVGPGFEPEAVAPAPGEQGEKDEELRQLLKEVESLPEAYRQVVMLYYYEDVTYRDLARILGIAPGTVNQRLTKARQLLRERLSVLSRNSD
jgi:RNA polymerase sigma-70 factor (ECF subfamily)